MLYPLSAFITSEFSLINSPPDYWYEGRCPYTGQVLRLPRTGLACAIAHSLMAQLSQTPEFNQEGKMYGVLLVQTPAGQLGVLKAFSGLLAGQSLVEGWVPPIPGRERVALQEAQTLAALDRIKQQLLDLRQMPERQLLQAQLQAFSQQLAELNEIHRQRKQARQVQRQKLADVQGEALAVALETLDDQSRRDGLERRRLKQRRDDVLGPLRDAIAQADAQILALKRQRQGLSRQLQEQMHQTYCLTNFAGESQTLNILGRGSGLPTGTGDCCAPKLLQYAAVQGLTPLAMAEFWWGPARGDKAPGQFYGACEERCQPIMGFLLAGLPASDAD
ncbi:MAG TPA: RluA family pseudouridine synthase, partial [Trichocoleus sp.]